MTIIRTSLILFSFARGPGAPRRNPPRCKDAGNPVQASLTGGRIFTFGLITDAVNDNPKVTGYRGAERRAPPVNRGGRHAAAYAEAPTGACRRFASGEGYAYTTCPAVKTGILFHNGFPPPRPGGEASLPLPACFRKKAVHSDLYNLGRALQREHILAYPLTVFVREGDGQGSEQRVHPEGLAHNVPSQTLTTGVHSPCISSRSLVRPSEPRPTNSR